MNIKSFFKKPIIALFLVVGALGMVVTTAYSTFYFANNFNTSEEASPIGDAIRANQTFGEESDVVVSNVEYYDVVFLAQCALRDNVNNGIYYYSNNTAAYYGKWSYDEENWPDESEQNNYVVNGCYIGPRIYRNIAEVTNGMLDDLGEPNVKPFDSSSNYNTSCGLADHNSGGANKYYLDFMGWALTINEDIYGRANGCPTDTDNYHYVSGTYPTDLSLARFNTLLSQYDEYAIEINGRKTIVFYPMYSTGKDYFSYHNGEKTNLKDCIDITKENGTILHFAYDSGFTSELFENSTSFNDANYEVYRYTNLLINESNLSTEISFNYVIKNHLNCGGGTPAWPDDTESHWEIKSSNNQTISLNNQIGRFNIYLFLKKNYGLSDSMSGISDDQQAIINDFLAKKGIYIYGDTYISNTFTYKYDEFLWLEYFDCRSAYIVVERVYEPRVIGGSSLDLNYNDPQSYKLNFTRQGTEGVLLRSYELRNRTVNVPSNDNDPTLKYIDYTFYNADGKPRRQYLIPAYYFAIQVALDQNTVYDQKLYGSGSIEPDDATFTDRKYAPNEYKDNGYFPTYQYKDFGDVTRTEDYSSKKYLVSLQDIMNGSAEEKYIKQDLNRIKVRTYDNGQPGELQSLAEWGKGSAEWNAVYNNVKLIRFKVTGTYNIYTIINYDENNRPNSVDIWTYRLHNIFVNIYDPDDFGGQILEVGSNYLDTSKYSYRCEDYYYLETPILGTDNYVRQADWTIPSEIGVSGNIVTFEQLLKYYDQKGKRLQDVVTGEYVAYQDYVENPFIVRKNYFLQVVPK